jgi:uncharacterized membrane protein
VNRFFLFFLRLLMMAFAFFVACIVTGATLAFLTRAVTPEDVRSITGDGTWISVMFGVLTVAGLVAYASIRKCSAAAAGCSTASRVASSRRSASPSCF